MEVGPRLRSAVHRSAPSTVPWFVPTARPPRPRRYHGAVRRRAESEPVAASLANAGEQRVVPDPILVRDRALIQAWVDGDADAGVTLLENYRGLVYRACVRFGVRRDDDVLDLWQELMVRVLGHLQTLAERVRASFAGYLIFNVRDLAVRYRRPPEAESPEPARDRSGAHEAWDAIQHCWDELPPREHRVFELRYLQGHTLGEVATVLGSNANAIAQAIFRLGHKMRACLEGQGFRGGEPT